MIKPVSLWNFIHECEIGDAEYIGRICLALAGKSVTFTRPERIQFAMIKKDNADMDERISVKKEVDRERKQAWRERNAAERGRTRTDADGRGQEVGSAEDAESASSSIHPSIHPSIPPSVHPSVRPEDNITSVSVGVADEPPPRTRMDVPDYKTVLAAAKGAMGIPEGYASWWYAEMIARDWTKSDGSPIGNANWRPVLKSWYNRATPDELAKIAEEEKVRKANAPRKFTEDDWALCRERCANYDACRCKAGCIVPPDKRPDPRPPEECQHFAAK